MLGRLPLLFNDDDVVSFQKELPATRLKKNGGICAAAILREFFRLLFLDTLLLLVARVPGRMGIFSLLRFAFSGCPEQECQFSLIASNTGKHFIWASKERKEGV